MPPARLLVVASASDWQTAKWLQQLEPDAFDIHLFDPLHGLLCPGLSGITVHTGWRKRDVPPGVRLRYRWPLTWGYRRLEARMPGLWRHIVPESGRMLAGLIDRLRPDCIQTMGIQVFGYALSEARSLLGGLDAATLYTCKGSDIYWYRDDDAHRVRIEEFLGYQGFMTANGERDVRLAQEHGFRGEVVGLFQGMGAWPIKRIRASSAARPPSGRRLVAVKGLQTDRGRGLLALQSLEQCSELLRGYRVRVYQAQPEVREYVARMVLDGMDIACFRGTPEEMLQLFGEARLALGVSASDGIPNAMVEAMIMGALPVQTNPGRMTEELVTDGVNGLLIPADDVAAIAKAVRRGLTDDALVDFAAVHNATLTEHRYDESVVRPKLMAAYRRVLQGVRT